MDRLRVGIVGCGGISAAHADGYAALAESAEVVACCDVADDKAAAIAARTGPSARVFADWKHMLRECPLDAVDICLPHHLHCPAILDAAEAGKHILCEKPLCRTLKEADRIQTAVRRAGVTYMASHNQMFHPCLSAAREVLASGALGRAFYLRTQDCGVLTWDRQRMGWRADVKTQGGGELIDTGYHPTYMLLSLAGSPVVKVAAVTARLRLDFMQAEDTAAVTVLFQSGAIGQVFTSWAMPRAAGTHQVHVMCSDGQLWGTGPDLWIHPAGQTEPEHRQFPKVNTIHAAVAHFVECLRSGRQPVAGLKEAREVLEVILRAYAAAGA